jgi:hypothetical protein
MNNLYHNPSTPEVLETTYVLDDTTRQRMIDTVLSQKDTANYHGGYTFQVEDPHGDFKKLYDYFFKTVESVFGVIDTSVKNRNWCWANVYNKNNFKTNLHNHIRTSSINAIYYLKLPEDMSENEGGLILVSSDDQEELLFLPEEQDLLIMPNYILHEPQQHSSLDYRIAINMEICINNSIATYYVQDNIYKTATIKL